MPRLIDLTATLDPRRREQLPEEMKMAGMVLSPNIEYLHPAEAGGKNQFCMSLGCSHDELPDGEGWGAENLSEFSSHCGTHVDAPLHSGSHCEGRKSRTITDIDLEELYRPGIVLDVQAWVTPGEEITIEMLDKALEKTETKISQGDAVLIRTGQERFDIGDPRYFNYPGTSRASTLHLTRQGATILGTDALGWDRPFGRMSEQFRATGDKRLLWDGHKAIVEKEAFIVQQMANLAALPFSGFMVGFFPIKLAECSAAPARVVAFID